MFSNTEIRVKCQFQGAGCTGVSTIEMKENVECTSSQCGVKDTVMVCNSCCLDIAEGCRIG